MSSRFWRLARKLIRSHIMVRPLSGISTVESLPRSVATLGFPTKQANTFRAGQFWLPRILIEPQLQRGAGRHACNLAQPTDRLFHINETSGSRQHQRQFHMLHKTAIGPVSCPRIACRDYFQKPPPCSFLLPLMVLPYDASQPEQTTRKTLKVNGRPGLLPSRPLSTTPTPGRNPLIKFFVNPPVALSSTTSHLGAARHRSLHLGGFARFTTWLGPAT